MGRLTLQDIQSNVDYKKKIVDMPEWGGEIEIRTLSVKQEMELQAIKSNNDLVFQLIMMCCINEDGSPLFDDVELLKQKHSEGILHLYNEIMALNKKNDGDIEELAKNS